MILSVFMPYLKRLEATLEFLEGKYFTLMGISIILSLLKERSINDSWV
jgi:hypothetical protein